MVRPATLLLVLCSLGCSAVGLGQAGLDASAQPKTAAVEGCATCHADLPGPLREPARLLRGDVHAAAGLGCSSCHGGDAKAQTALAAHRGGGFLSRPASTAEMAVLCGRCHQKPADN